MDMSFTHVNKNISGEYCVIICRVVLQHTEPSHYTCVCVCFPGWFSDLAFLALGSCTISLFFTGNYSTNSVKGDECCPDALITKI